MQPKIHDYDLEFKSAHIKKFLDGGDRVKVTVRFWGRELAHTVTIDETPFRDACREFDVRRPRCSGFRSRRLQDEDP